MYKDTCNRGNHLLRREFIALMRVDVPVTGSEGADGRVSAVSAVSFSCFVHRPKHPSRRRAAATGDRRDPLAILLLHVAACFSADVQLTG